MSKLSEKLFRSCKNVYDTDVSKNEIYGFCEEYKEFLSSSKTERLTVERAAALAKAAGFKEFDGKTANPGDKIYSINRGKGLIMAVIGENPAIGANIVAAHIDSPRLDLKPNPLYEDISVALFKTHYYGGIKKYQWTAVPMAIHGVVYKGDGEKVDISIGENDDEPCFCVSDLLIHLAGEQMGKKLAEGIEGENLNLIAGSLPHPDKDEKDRVKLAVLSLLNEKYGITEEDFVSAELEAVPAGKARDIGLDRSLVGAYGHDDRVCAYTGLRAVLDSKQRKKTSVLILADKEEIGSTGNTGMQSEFYKNFIYDIAEINGISGRKFMSESSCLSADVCNAVDPQYQSVSEKNNSAFLNCGVGIVKYTGARGKSGTSDASAEFISKLRKLFADNGVVWQAAELGRVDAGGGGTVAQDIARMDVETIDCGVPLLSMHAPFELAAKADIFMAYKAYKSFYEFY